MSWKDVTPKMQQVLRGLTADFERPGAIAQRVGLKSVSSIREQAAKYCTKLVKAGYAVKGGSRMFPEWRSEKFYYLTEQDGSYWFSGNGMQFWDCFGGPDSEENVRDFAAKMNLKVTVLTDGAAIIALQTKLDEEEEG